MVSNTRFPKLVRLRKKAEFDRVFTGGVWARNQIVRIAGYRNQDHVTRLGLVVSRRVGNAIARNRWKRLIREAFRLAFSELPNNLDLLVIPIQSNPPPLEAIRRALVRLAAQIDRRIEGAGR